MLAISVMVAGVILLSFGAVESRIALERIVDVQYHGRHAEWVAAGRPTGGDPTRHELSFWRSGFARDRVFWQWLLVPPGWITADPTSASALRSMRRAVAVSAVGVATIVVGILHFAFIFPL